MGECLENVVIGTNTCLSWTAIRMQLALGFMAVVLGLLIDIHAKNDGVTWFHTAAVGVLAIIRDLLLHKENRPHCIFTRCVKTYGAIYSVCTGLSSGVVVLNSSQYAKEAMVDKHSSTSSKKLTMALQTLSLDKTMVALSDYRRDHSLMKKRSPEAELTTTYISVRTLIDMIDIVLDQLIAFAFKQVIGRDVESVYVEEMGTALSMSIKQIDEAVVEDPASGALVINWKDFIPYVSRWFPNRKLHGRLNEVIQRRSAVVNALIQQHREIYWRNSNLQECEGYLEMILRDGQGLEKRQLETAKWEPITESIITTKVALEWAMFELARILNIKIACTKNWRKSVAMQL